MKKKIVAIVMTFLLAVSMNIPVSAAPAISKIDCKRVSQDFMSTAQDLSFDQTYTGTLSDSAAARSYKIKLPSSGRINLESISKNKEVYYKLYDHSGEELWSKSTFIYDMPGSSTVKETFDLTKGIYYLTIEKESYYDDGARNFSLKIGFDSANESFEEAENGIDNEINCAHNISIGQEYRGQIARNDDKDFYCFTLPSSGRISLSALSKMKTSNYTIYDSSGQEIWGDSTWGDDVLGGSSTKKELDLVKGTYYFAVSKRNDDDTGIYSFTLNFKSAEESFEETKDSQNNDMEHASKIDFGQEYKGQIAENDEKDFYQFTLSSSQKINVQTIAQMQSLCYTIYDTSGQEIWSDYGWDEKDVGQCVLKKDIYLESGTYYFVASKRDGTGNYKLHLSLASSDASNGSSNNTSNDVEEQSFDVYLSRASYTYTGKTIKPSVTVKDGSKKLRNRKDYTVSYSNNKYVGTAEVTVKGKGNYSGEITKTFTINPKGTSISRVRAYSGAFMASWGRQTRQISGYEIQYAANRNFYDSITKTVLGYRQTSLKISDLERKKTYYVRVRTYKTNEDQTYFSSWSKVKKVTTKR